MAEPVAERTASWDMPAQREVRRSMAALLESVGLDYRGGFVQAGRSRVHYVDYGDGPPVVLVHGAGEGSAIWYRQIAELSKRFRVIAPDNPVFGLSDQTVLTESMYDFASQYLIGFLDALGLDSVRIAGHSLGGLAALSLGIEQPGRIERLALVDSMGFGRAMPLPIRLASVPGFGWLIRRPSRRVVDWIYSGMGLHGDSPVSLARLGDYAYAVSTVPGHSKAKLAGLRRLTNLWGQIRLFTRSELAKINIPTMILWGENDGYFPVSHARQAADMIPNAELHVIPKASHVPFWDRPERVSGLLGQFFAA